MSCKLCTLHFLHPVRAECGHKVCRDCFVGYNLSSEKPICPVCRLTSTTIASAEQDTDESLHSREIFPQDAKSQVVITAEQLMALFCYLVPQLDVSLREFLLSDVNRLRAWLKSRFRENAVYVQDILVPLKRLSDTRISGLWQDLQHYLPESMLRFLRELTPEERRVILQIYPDITTWQQFAAAPAPSSQERAGSAAPDDNSPAHTYKSTAVTTSSVTATPSATTAPSVTTAPSATAGPVTGSAVTVPIAAAVALPVGGTQHPLAVTAPVTSQSRSAFPGTVVNAGYERTAKTTVPLSTSNTDTTVSKQSTSAPRKDVAATQQLEEYQQRHQEAQLFKQQQQAGAVSMQSPLPKSVLAFCPLIGCDPSDRFHHAHYVHMCPALERCRELHIDEHLEEYWHPPRRDAPPCAYNEQGCRNVSMKHRYESVHRCRHDVSCTTSAEKNPGHFMLLVHSRGQMQPDASPVMCKLGPRCRFIDSITHRIQFRHKCVKVGCTDASRMHIAHFVHGDGSSGAGAEEGTVCERALQ